jgi:tetratricopeptide (TPR) repeat protein
MPVNSVKPIIGAGINNNNINKPQANIAVNNTQNNNNNNDNKIKAQEYYNKALNKTIDFSQKIGFCNKAIALDPTYLEAYEIKCNALVNLQRYEDVIECCNKAIQIDPNCSVVFC